jgi:hypothetical protein
MVGLDYTNVFYAPLGPDMSLLQALEPESDRPPNGRHLDQNRSYRKLSCSPMTVGSRHSHHLAGLLVRKGFLNTYLAENSFRLSDLSLVNGVCSGSTPRIKLFGRRIKRSR